MREVHHKRGTTWRQVHLWVASRPMGACHASRFEPIWNGMRPSIESPYKTSPGCPPELRCTEALGGEG